MDFTREPIIETVITPKEGCTLVVRSSKSSGQEEHFVDAVEVVTFGSAIFLRSRERPKAFLVPVTDYEVLEVRETRLLLKNVGVDRAIKIAGGREAPLNASKPEAKHAPAPVLEKQPEEAAATTEAKSDARADKKRDRRRNHRRRRGKEDDAEKGSEEDVEGAEKLTASDADKVELPAPHLTKSESGAEGSGVPASSMLSSLLSPPPNLISETIARYKDNVLFKGAFFSKEDDSVGFEEDKEDEGDEEGHESIPAHREVLHEGMSEQEEEIQIPEMSLDYPVYGATKEPEVIHHVPHAAGFVAVHEAEEPPAVEATPVFKALPEVHLVLPVEPPFFNFEDDVPSTIHEEGSDKSHDPS